jgi:(p)ppGpp synthase/HD superfamily hydrolase
VVAEYGDEETVCAAYLHDTIEKPPVTAARSGVTSARWSRNLS